MTDQKSNNENRMSAVDILDTDSKKRQYEIPKLTSHGSVAEITKLIGGGGTDGIFGAGLSVG